jgi:hypothetical protein
MALANGGAPASVPQEPFAPAINGAVNGFGYAPPAPPRPSFSPNPQWSAPQPSPRVSEPPVPPAGAPYPPVYDRPVVEAYDYDDAPIPLPVQPSAELDLKRLTNNLPRKLIQGESQTFELEIPRSAIARLTPGTFDDAFPLRPEIFASRAIATRLTAPNTAITIEPQSPETVWIEPDSTTGRLSSDSDTLSWRWRIVGREHGTYKVQVSMTARLIGPDGLAADTPFPLQTVDVTVTRNGTRMAKRLSLAIALLAAGTLAGLLASGRLSWLKTLIG